MNLDEIISLITASYGGDLSNPHFYFVDPALERRPYHEIVNRIESIGDVRISEYSDANTYASFAYVIENCGRSWALELSMLGPIGVFARIGEHGWDRLLRPGEGDLLPFECEVFGLLVEQKITFPVRAILEHPLDMILDYTDPGNVRVYHALFSDEDFLPWEFSPLYPELSGRDRSWSE
ncbi:hypothetical protein FHR81_002737 [Actinoalloteichus hoggarensis]|uniref:Uncharacterized protein n=1 Tax=Actinoalloteichus hoggarensis TaxID=1470176 RepID=A0A221VXV1_9PSEU|nr:hypothetical protein [Actinoalloteichus hoggarensis]ASO18334.1 hypothetical protein AHOG_03380 [Actinoalloteichus hoggarensis]MBB5921697.1 hypothetical protein [Actinoalloteichus hoggarensis]